MNKIDIITNHITSIFENIDNDFYWYSYAIGFIFLILFDSSIVFDDILIFGIFSFMIAPMIGYLILLAIIFINGVIGLINDIFKKLNLKIFKLI